MSRVLKTGNNQITQSYQAHYNKVQNGQGWAIGTDVVKYKSQLDYIVAHSAGKVIKVIDYMVGTNGKLDRESMGYGCYVMILHKNKYQNKHVVTLYAHLANVDSKIKEGVTVEKGQVLGFMGNTGNSHGAHLHFCVRLYHETPNINSLHDVNKFEWIDPTPYLDTDLPNDVVHLDENSYADYPEGSNKYYRIRTSFADSKSSKGSYSKWANAFKRWKEYESYGYHIYDDDGNQLDVEVAVEEEAILTETSYPNYTSSSEFYRIRKSFTDSKSSKGSYSKWAGAFNCWSAWKGEGYHVYDNSGKQLDGVTTTTTSTTQTTQTAQPVKAELTKTSYPDYTGNQHYYVQKKFKSWLGSKGAFKSWANAFNTWSKNKDNGYHVYDNEGNQLD